jgi:hypothetical protein
MSIEQEFNKSYQRLGAIPPEQRAVRSTGGLLGNLAKVNANRQLTALETGTRRMGIENQLSNAREDVRLAKRDAMPALALGVANVGLRGLGVYEQNEFNKQQELENQKQLEQEEMITSIIRDNYDELLKIIRGETEEPAYNENTIPSALNMAIPKPAGLNIQPFNLPQRTQPANTFTMRPLNIPQRTLTPMPSYQGGLK